MKPHTTPDDMITECTENIGKFLREGMQQHATDELKSAISRINMFHHRRDSANEISMIGEILACCRSMQVQYNIPSSFYAGTVKMLESERCHLIAELESLK